MRNEKAEADLKLFEERFVERTEAVVGRLFFEPPFVLCASTVNPFRLNERLRLQKGLFLCPGNVEASFMDNLLAVKGHDDPQNVLRIIIPGALAAKVREELFNLNITRRVLFPGLDGYAQALGIYHPVFNPNELLHKRAMGIV
jgi:hypothetical protein